MKQMKKTMIGTFFIALVLLSGCNLSQDEKDDETATELVPIEEIATAESLETRLQRQYGIDRSDYGTGEYGGKNFKIIEIFKDLPPIPDDFWREKYLIMTGKASIEGVCNLTQEYYTQPEFITNSFVDFGIGRYKKPDPSHWTPEGYGTFPHELETITSGAVELEGCTFFHSSWGAETWQGFSLNPIYPGSASVGGVETSINPEESKKYISMEVSPKSIVVGPAYLVFSEEWSKQVRVKIKIANNTPAGTYAVGFDVGRAPIEDAKVWLDQYGELYQQKGWISVSEPQFIWVIKVR